MNDVLILGGARTPMTEYVGALKDVSAIELGAIAARGAFQKTGVKPEWVDHVVFGNVLQTSADAIYGSGLRAGDANIGTVPAYTQVNVGIKREFLLPNDPKPMTIRFDVVNLFDNIYEIRDGSGIGESSRTPWHRDHSRLLRDQRHGPGTVSRHFAGGAGRIRVQPRRSRADVDDLHDRHGAFRRANRLSDGAVFAQIRDTNRDQHLLRRDSADDFRIRLHRYADLQSGDRNRRGDATHSGACDPVELFCPV